MSTRDPRERALRRLLRDARAEKPADMDWTRVEERLMREARRSTPVGRRTAYPLAWGALAIAAAAALWLTGGHARHDATALQPTIIEAAAQLRQDGDALALGSRVVAEDREVTVDHAGRATWTLAPHSSALLADRGERISVRLEHGSVLSEVVPNPKPETFVIEAANTRIAVHGTVFRVSLEDGHVLVQVQQGTVAVGPLGGGAAFLLKAPAHGEFAADGRSGTIDGRPVGETPEKRRGPLRLSPSRAPTPAATGTTLSPVASAELPSEPSINDIEAGIARVVDVAAACFKRHTQSADGVQITVRTALSLKVDGSGAVSAVDFQPPLSPDAEECAAAGIAQITFAASQQGANVTRMLELKR